VSRRGGVELRVDGLGGTVGLSLGADANQTWVGTHTNHALRLLTNNTEQVRVQVNGHVGIGNTNPDHVLVVGPPSGGRHLVVNGMPTARWGLTTGSFDFAIQNDGSGAWETRLLLTRNGNVGIGTTGPDTRLNVTSSAPSSQAVLAVSNGNADTRLALWSGYNAGANPPAILYTHDLRFGIVAAPHFADGSTWVEAMRVTSSGNVGIGTATPAARLHVLGTVLANNLPSPSDTRWKTRVTRLTHVLEKLDRIRGVSFEWNALAASLGCTPGRQGIGVIAQEVEAVFPELVTTWGEDAYKAIDYGRLAAVLVEAIKVLTRRIEAVEGRSR
jgi:hypothetical protein